MYGQIRDRIMGNGKTIIWMGRALTTGQMGEDMRAIILRTGNMGMVSIFGQMVEYLKGHDVMGSSMGRVMEKLKLEYGKMESLSDGFHNIEYILIIVYFHQYWIFLRFGDTV